MSKALKAAFLSELSARFGMLQKIDPKRLYRKDYSLVNRLSMMAVMAM